MFYVAVEVDSLAAWRAPISGFIAEFLILGFTLSSGIVLLGLHEDYGVPHDLLLLTALIGLGTILIMSPAMEWISVRIGPKLSVLTSVVLMTSSMILLFFVPITGVSVVALLGVSTGIGRSFGHFIFYKFTMAAFRKRRGVASSVLKTGASIGSILFPPSYAFLLDVYGVRITLFLIGGLFLNLLIALILIPSVVIDDRTGRRLTPKPTWRCSCNIREPREMEAKSENEDLVKVKTEMIKDPLPVKLSYLVFVSCMICLGGIGTLINLNVFALYIDELGFSKYMIAAALSTKSGADIFTRVVLTGILFDKAGKRGKLLVLAVAQMIGFVGILPMLFQPSAMTTVIFIHSVTLGVWNGIVAVGWMQIISTLSGNFYLGRILSIVMLVTGVSLVGSSLAFGAIKRAMGTYKPLYFFVSSSVLVSSALFVVGACIFSRCVRQSKQDVELKPFHSKASHQIDE